MNLTEMSLSDRIFALFTGETGTRKTTSAASFAKIGPVNFFDLDFRIKALLKLDFPGKENITVDQYGPNDYIRFCKDLESIKMPSNGTIVIDGLTAFCNMVLNYAYAVRGGAGNMKNKGIIEVNTLEDYGMLAAAGSTMVDILKPMKCHVILTAHLIAPEAIKDKDGNIVSVQSMTRLLLTGGKKLALELPGSFDEIYYFYTKPSPISGRPPRFLVNTIHSGMDFAKTALPLPQTMDITDKTLWSYIEAVLPKENK